MEELQPRRGPGRPPNPANVAQATVQSDSGPARRPDRKPFGTMQQRMTYAERPGFHRHRFNDWPGRIERALEAGYEHVKGKEGKNVRWTVGTAEGGGPLYAYLMEIPEELWLEDMAAQQLEVNAREEAIKGGKVEGADPNEQKKFYGGAQITHGR